MRSIIIGFWLSLLGWGFIMYPTGKVENMDAAGGLFFLIGSLIILYTLLFSHIIPFVGIRIGLSFFYLAWGWDWAFWKIAPSGDYLDIEISRFTLTAEAYLILIGLGVIGYTILKGYQRRTQSLSLEFAAFRENCVALMTWENLQYGVGKFLGISFEVIFLLFGFYIFNLFAAAYLPTPGTQFGLSMALIFAAMGVLMALGNSASGAVARRGLPATTAGVYVILLGAAFLAYPTGDVIRALLLIAGGALIIKDAKNLNAKNYLPGKGKYAGFGVLLLGIFDFIYLPQGNEIGSMMTPSLLGGIFMGQRFLEGLALVLMFVVLVIIPQQKVSWNTLRRVFVIPLLIYGLSLLVAFGTIEFAAEQLYSVWWTRGIQMTVVTGALVIIFGVIRYLDLIGKSRTHLLHGNELSPKSSI